MLFKGIHDIVDLIGVFDLNAIGVNLHLDAPEPEGLFLRLVLLEKNVYCVVY